jgi:beta-lactamase regulating signal transducer with metallopeptidase domain
MTTELALRGLLFAGELFFAAIAIMAVAMEASTFAKRASLRHFIWTAAFGALLALPVLALILPSQFRLALLPAAAPVHSQVPVVEAVSHGGIPFIPPAPQPSWHFDLATIARGLAALWVIGIAIVVLRSIAALIGLVLLRRNSAPLRERIPSLPDIGRAYQIRVSTKPQGCGPVTWGFVRPVILLPFASKFWPQERLQAVLLHELAHIRRRDSVTQFLSLIACALYWPNPLVWIGARTMRGDAEMAADDAVIVSGVRPSSYAGELLQLASEFRSRQSALAGVSLFMAAPSQLETRVASVLAPKSLRSGVTAMDVLKITSVGILAVGAIALARPSLAQDAPPAPPSVAEAPLPPPPPAAPADAATSMDVAAPPAPPAPAAPAEPVIAADGHHHHSIDIYSTTHDENGRQVKRTKVIIDGTTYDTDAEIARIQPRIDRAMAESHAREIAMEKVREEEPKIRAAVDQAMRNARPQIERAMAEARQELKRQNLDVKISERVNEALKHAQIRIELEAARMNAEHDRTNAEHDRVDAEHARMDDESNDGNADSDNDH